MLEAIDNVFQQFVYYRLLKIIILSENRRFPGVARSCVCIFHLPP